MKVRYTLHNVAFEWDSQKAATNLRKHKVSFELACEAFFDPLSVISMKKLLGVNFENGLSG
jgi:hypothetical protein